MDQIAFILQGSLATLQLTIYSWVFALVVGLLFALIQRNKRRVVAHSMDFFAICLRGFPQLIFLYLVYFGLAELGINISPMAAAVIALGLTEASYTAEIYRGGFSTVPRTIIEAAESLGMSKVDVFRKVEFPILLRFLVPPAMNIFIALLKLSSFASAIGVSEILYRGQVAISFSGQIVYVGVSITLIYLIFTIPLSRLVARYETKLRSSFKVSAT